MLAKVLDGALQLEEGDEAHLAAAESGTVEAEGDDEYDDLQLHLKPLSRFKVRPGRIALVAAAAASQTTLVQLTWHAPCTSSASTTQPLPPQPLRSLTGEQERRRVSV